MDIKKKTLITILTREVNSDIEKIQKKREKFVTISPNQNNISV